MVRPDIVWAYCEYEWLGGSTTRTTRWVGWRPSCACAVPLMPLAVSVASAVELEVAEVLCVRSWLQSCISSDASRLLARGGGDTRYVASARGELAFDGMP